MPDMMDDSLDGGPPSVGSGEMMIGQCNSMSGTIIAPVSAKKVLYDWLKFCADWFNCVFAFNVALQHNCNLFSMFFSFRLRKMVRS